MNESDKTASPVKAKQKGRSKPAPKRRRKSKKLPPFNVILLDDNDHNYEYVIEMLRSILEHTEEKGYQMAKEVDKSVRFIGYTAHRELAELKREQIHAWGTDWRIATCRGSMSSVIEPAS